MRWLITGLIWLGVATAAPLTVFDGRTAPPNSGLPGSRVAIGGDQTHDYQPLPLAEVAARATVGPEATIPFVAGDGYDGGAGVARLAIGPGAIGWWSAELPLPRAVRDGLASLRRPTLLVALRGQQGHEPVEIGLAGGAPRHQVTIPLDRYGAVDRAWTLYRLPLTDFTALAPDLPVGQLSSLLFFSPRPGPVQIDLGLIRFEPDGGPVGVRELAQLAAPAIPAPATAATPPAATAPATAAPVVAPAAPAAANEPVVEPAPAATTAEPTTAATPATPAEPAATATPATPAEPASTPATPAEPAATATPATPAEPAATVPPATPVTPAEPVVAATPIEPATAATSPEPATPAEPLAPAGGVIVRPSPAATEPSEAGAATRVAPTPGPAPDAPAAGQAPVPLALPEDQQPMLPVAFFFTDAAADQGFWPASSLSATWATNQGERGFDATELKEFFVLGEGDTLPVVAVTDPGRESTVLQLEVKKPGFAWWVARIGQLQWETADLSAYLRNGRIELAVRGDAGEEAIRIGLFDRQDPSQVALVPLSQFGTITTDWQILRVPLRALKAANPKLDWTRIGGLQLASANGRPLTLRLDDLRIVNPVGGGH